MAIVKNGLFSAAPLVTPEGSIHSIFHYCSDLSFGVVIGELTDSISLMYQNCVWLEYQRVGYDLCFKPMKSCHPKNK